MRGGLIKFTGSRHGVSCLRGASGGFLAHLRTQACNIPPSRNGTWTCWTEGRGQRHDEPCEDTAARRSRAEVQICRVAWVAGKMVCFPAIGSRPTPKYVCGGRSRRGADRQRPVSQPITRPLRPLAGLFLFGVGHVEHRLLVDPFGAFSTASSMSFSSTIGSTASPCRRRGRP
jgi:hypothetical protein